MSSITSSIERVIIHKVNHLVENGLVLSQVELPIGETSEFQSAIDLLKESIDAYLDHQFIYRGEFITPSLTGFAFCDTCSQLMSNSRAFVQKSQEIARHLYDVMNQDARRGSISPGDMVLCLCKEESENTPRLALLKMDPKDSFVDKVETVNGKTCVTLERRSNVISTGVLQKFAYIYPDDHGLKVLDFQQRRVGVTKPVASFFSSAFLQCKIMMPPQQLTLAAAHLGEEFAEKKRAVWGDIGTDQFLSDLGKALHQDFIDLDEFAQASITDEKDRAAFLETMRKRLPTLTFKPEMATGMALASKALFSGDNGLKVEINSNAVGPGKTLEYRWSKDGAICHVQIKTSYWKEKVHLKREKESRT